MPKERLGSTGFLKGLLSILHPERPASQNSSELLDEHEESLRKLYPDGRPSGDGSEQFDRLTELRDEEVRWQTVHRRRLQLVGLLGAIVALAIAIALAWDRFAA
jgi:hypothetical protein